MDVNEYMYAVQKVVGYGVGLTESTKTGNEYNSTKVL